MPLLYEFKDQMVPLSLLIPHVRATNLLEMEKEDTSMLRAIGSQKSQDEVANPRKRSFISLSISLQCRRI